ncbi:MAG: hypothetical protein DRJ65_20150 [Acidobacteria bacterium]|nr:MAG: hypothetical protein DRJ65_20150 [Acidobacteriota bacterium]
MKVPLLSVDPDAAFDAVVHDQIGGPYQVPAELVRLAIANGASRVEVQCRRGRVIVEAQGAAVPEAAIEALNRASGQGDDIARLQALAALEDLDAAALGWAVGLNPRRLLIRIWERHSLTTLSAKRGQPFRLSHGVGRQEDGFFIELTGPHLNHQRALRWLETACRFSPVAVVVNGRNQQRELDSGCFRARIASPLPAVVALGVDLDAPRLWLLRHGVVATRVGVPNWPPFEAAVELQGQVEGRASAAQLRQAVAPHLEGLVSRVVELGVRVVPRIPELGFRQRQRIILLLLKAAERGLSLENIRRAPLFEIVDVGGIRWVSLEALQQWRGALPGVVDCGSTSEDVEKPYLCLGVREREKTSGLIGRALSGAVINRAAFGPKIASSARTFFEFARGMVGPRPLPESDLVDGERVLVQALQGALRTAGRSIDVTVCPGQRPPQRWGRHLCLARDRPSTRWAVRAVSEDPACVYVVAVALKLPRWTVAAHTRSNWLLGESDELV